ncbi:MAG: iron-containing alcohol dehydrogenase [Alphaproteobacteria bacterium]|nr:iron-containing alcohol dehydrogenase [Alphaproteobacteria bacterium]
MSGFPSGIWRFPTEIRFGPGRVDELASACGDAGMRRPLIVTDEGLARHSMIGGARDALQDAGMAAEVFARVRGNPTGTNVRDGMEAFRDGDFDGVVAFGGGSALDAGKAIAMATYQQAELFDLHVSAEGPGRGPGAIDGSRVAPVVAVPTTAGTGSETGRAAVVTEEATQQKRIFVHPAMMPRIVIEDPKLTVGLPANLTAWTGLDALAHCFEALSVPELHPFCDGVAMEGMRLIHTWLPRAVDDGRDLEARGHMLVAASMGSTAFQKGLGAIHALSHPVGARYDTHHGLTNAVFFPYVLAFNAEAIADKCDRLSAYLGLAKPGVTGVMDWVLELRERFEVPHTLAGLGVDDGELDALAEAAAADPSAPSNPVPLDAMSLKRLYLDALEGRLP